MNRNDLIDKTGFREACVIRADRDVPVQRACAPDPCLRRRKPVASPSPLTQPACRTTRLSTCISPEQVVNERSLLPAGNVGATQSARCWRPPLCRAFTTSPLICIKTVRNCERCRAYMGRLSQTRAKSRLSDSRRAPDYDCARPSPGRSRPAAKPPRYRRS